MKHTPRSRLLLIELVLDLCIFAMCAVVCIGLLVRARAMSRQSTELTQAVYLAQSAAERLRAGMAPDSGELPEGFTLQTSAADDSESGLYTSLITVFRDGRELYTIEIALPEEVSAP